VEKDHYLRCLKTESYKESRIEKAELISEIVNSYLQNGNIIVDLGSGTGLIKSHLSQKFSKPILGIEIDRKVILTNQDVCVGDATRLPLKDKSVDFLICNHLYEHVEQESRSKFFRELRRVLADEGSIYMTAGNKFQLIEPHYQLPFLSWLPVTIARYYLRITGRGRDYSHIHFLSYFHLIHELQEVNLSVKDITYDVLVRYRKKIKKRYEQIFANFIMNLSPKITLKLFNLFSPQWFLILRKPS
jgi:ubiquinone/menaquinone biosynthesis C-methylase UbiE